ncbi:methyl-accepting chemotaxis protein [Cupriavidus numazuensis]|uniref:Methyl-accepting chemotaxis protein III n=1 Tax=Cupriavidus numazuensis TaxID=221992 RepID=A0ABN7Q241_9BURK|nr:methyl-accepting chemotaxis protein [Cupriavidus numazuensis]CAG2144704.1 Methyl-accepting chemotaxis protein III [Cupriavidus numazuensis]
MRNFTVSASLSVVLVSFVAFMSLSNIVSWRGLRDTASSVERLSTLTDEVQAINGAFAATQRARVSIAGAQSAARSGEGEVARDLLKTATTRLLQGQQLIERFAAMPRSSVGDRELAKKLVTSYSALNATVRAAQEAMDSGDTATYDRISAVDSIQASRTFNVALDEFSKHAEARGKEDEAAARTTFHGLQTVIAVASALALLVAVAARVALSRIVQRPLKEVGEQLARVAAGDLTVRVERRSRNEIYVLSAVATRMQDGLSKVVASVRASSEAMSAATREIAAGNMDLSARTEQQAASLEQTAASMTQMSEAVTQNAENTRHANSLAKEAKATTEAGRKEVEAMVRTIGEVSAASDRITEITGLIDGIAFQTNILALNAAVEAARAGEHGRGFAVVAGEVRSLAQRASASAREIKQLIEESTGKARHGAEQATSVNLTMARVSHVIAQVTDIIGEISVASEEQSRNLDQVHQAICQIDQVTQQNAALVEQSAAAAGSLQERAESMNREVMFFTLADSSGRLPTHDQIQPRA